MPSNFRTMLFGMLAVGSLMQVCAQVNISGTVKDQTGQPMQGVAVSLSTIAMTATTDAAGHYSLNSTVVENKSNIRTAKNGAMLENGVLKFRVNDNSTRVRIRIYDLLGNAVLTIMEKDLAPGSYSVPAVVAGLSSQLYFLNVTIGNNESVMMMPVAQKKSYHETSPASSAGQGLNALQKQAALPDTVKAQKTGYSGEFKPIASYTGSCDFIMTDTAWFWGNRATIPAATKVMTYVFLNRTNGAYTDAQVFWTTGGQTHSIAQQSTYDMDANSSGRVSFNLGTATGQYADFIEHTISTTVWNGNTTRVDGWGLPILIRLHCKDGYDAILGDQYHIFAMKRDSVFATFKNYVPAEFQSCANNGTPYRIIAPGKGEGSFDAGQPYATYMNAYLTSLAISGATTNQVFSCAGTPFGSNAALAGAVNRHVAQLPQAQWTDVTQYYKAAPANFYAKFWHEHSVDNKCYGFAYDDAEGQAAYTSHASPQYLIIAVGY